MEPETTETTIPPAEGENPPAETTTTETTTESPYLAESFVGYATTPTDFLLIMILGVLLFQLVLGRKTI